MKLKSQKGEKNYFATLTEKQVINIISQYNEGKYRKFQFSKIKSKEYNVNHITIFNILIKKSWKHISDKYIIKDFSNLTVVRDDPTKKLTDNQVIDLIGEFNKAQINRTDISIKYSAIYNVSKKTILSILRGETWKHISTKFPITKIRYIKHNKNKVNMANGNKLIDNQVIEILKLYKTSEYTYNDLGKMFNVSPITIGFIIRGKIWKHINRNNI